MTRDFFNNFIRNLFCSIDYYIYSSIEWVVQGIFDISTLRTYTKIVDQVRNKIYVLLGIFMLFKLSITLVNYLINPEQMSDNQKGMKKLVPRTILLLALLLLTPTIFRFLYRAQTVFVPMLPKIFIGKTVSDVNKTVTKNSNTMAVTLLQAFFHPYYSDKADDEFAPIDGSKEITSLTDFVQHVNDSNPLTIPLLGESVAGYSYEYRFFLSTIVGLITLGLLVAITLDVAIRLFKMLVLEMLAPIPIIGSISPTTDEQTSLQSWAKELAITFLDIFIKLSLVYLVLYFVTELNSNTLFVTWEGAEGSKISPLRLMYLKVFLILGLLIFAHQAPKFIRKMFGIKDGDEGNFLGSVAGGIAGFGSGLISGAISGQGLRGAISGGINGASQGYNRVAQQSQSSGAWRGGSRALEENNAPINSNRINDKSGILASLQNMSGSSKLRAESSKVSDTVEKARSSWQTAQTMAIEAENTYNNLISNGPSQGESDQDYNNRRAEAYNDWQVKLKISTEAEAKYNRARGSTGSSAATSRGKTARKVHVGKGENVNKNTASSVAQQAGSMEGTTIESRRIERTSQSNDNMR